MDIDIAVREEAKDGIEANYQMVIGFKESVTFFVKMHGVFNHRPDLWIIMLISDTGDHLKCSFRMVSEGLSDHIAIIKVFIYICQAPVSIVVCVNKD